MLYTVGIKISCFRNFPAACACRVETIDSWMVTHWMKMKLYHDRRISARPSAVALGAFDGLHIGHSRVIGSARKEGLLTSVFTFQDDLIREGKRAPRILSQRRKMVLLEKMGVEQCWIAAFSEIRDMSAEEFMEKILKEVCRAKVVCCGRDFHFGRGGNGTSAQLEAFCRENGIEARVAEPVLLSGSPVSSTRIREAAAEGRMEEAAALLGRPFSLDTPVVHGRQLGRTLGVPTINQPIPEDFVLPRFGVYASVVTICGKTYYGVTNIGVKPTVGADAPLSETWMPDYRGPELYGDTVVTELIAFIRPEQKFGSIRELQENIFRDRISAKKVIYKF